MVSFCFAIQHGVGGMAWPRGLDCPLWMFCLLVCLYDHDHNLGSGARSRFIEGCT